MRAPLVVWGIVACTAAAATDVTSPDAVDDPAPSACFERVKAGESLVQRMSMQVFDATGSIDESRATLYWQRGNAERARFLLRVTAPPARSGIAILAVERESADPDMYLYLPELRQVRRVTGRTFSGSMLGTDFSYEDFAELQGIARASVIRRLPAEEAADGSTAVIEVTPTGASSYARIVTRLDEARCLPLETRFLAADGTSRKTLELDPAGVREIEGRYFPYRLVMRDHEQGTRTELLIDEVTIDDALPASMFSPTALGAGH